MCVNPGVCVGELGGDQMVEVNGKNFLPCFAHFFLFLSFLDLTNITETVQLKYIHVYTFSCVYVHSPKEDHNVATTHPVM